MAKKDGLYKLSQLLGMFASASVISGGIFYSGAINLEQTMQDLRIAGYKDFGTLAYTINYQGSLSYLLFWLAIILGLFSFIVWLYAYRRYEE